MNGYDGSACQLRASCMSMFYHVGKMLAHDGSPVIGGKPIAVRMLDYVRLILFLRGTMAKSKLMTRHDT